MGKELILTEMIKADLYAKKFRRSDSLDNAVQVKLICVYCD